MNNSKNSMSLPAYSGIFLKFSSHYDRIADYVPDFTDEQVDELCNELGFLWEGKEETSAFYDDFHHIDEQVLIINIK